MLIETATSSGFSEPEESAHLTKKELTPDVSPETVVECAVVLAVEMEPLIEPYEVPSAVEYLQVAFLSVVKESVALVVPAGSALVGVVFVRITGKLSDTTGLPIPDR